MENKKEKKVALNDELLEKVSGGQDGSEDEGIGPKPWNPFEGYPVTCLGCGRTDKYDTPSPEYCSFCGQPL